MCDRGIETLFGDGMLEKLPELFGRFRIRRVFVVTGHRSWAAARGVELEQDLAGLVQFIVFRGFEENPRIGDVIAGIGVLSQSTADAVIGVGGGTAMDLAKAIAILADQEAEPTCVVIGQVPITRRRRRPLFLIPTTGGTGAEVTSFAVVYVDGRKHSLDHPFVAADCAIIDPGTLAGIPRRLAAVTGADALAQSIESFWSVRSTAASRGKALRALDLIRSNWQQSCDRPTVATCRAMAEAAYLAGSAIDVTRTTAPHALSYPLTIRYGIPHGHACALTLPGFLLFNAGVSCHDVVDPRGVSFVRDRIAELLARLGASTPSDGAMRLKNLIAGTGLETTLKELVRNPQAAIADAIADVNADRLANNPRYVSPGSLRSILNGVRR